VVEAEVEVEFAGEGDAIDGDGDGDGKGLLLFAAVFGRDDVWMVRLLLLLLLGRELPWFMRA
jgi:hypothetical protein